MAVAPVLLMNMDNIAVISMKPNIILSAHTYSVQPVALLTVKKWGGAILGITEMWGQILEVCGTVYQMTSVLLLLLF